MKIVHNINLNDKSSIIKRTECYLNLLLNLKNKGCDLVYKEFDLVDKSELIESCDVLIYNPLNRKVTVRDIKPPPKGCQIKKIIFLSDNELFPTERLFFNLNRRLPLLYKCKNVFVLTQDKLPSEKEEWIGYINRCWLQGMDVALFPKKSYTLTPESNPYFLFNTTFGTTTANKYHFYSKLSSSKLLSHKKVAHLCGSIWTGKNKRTIRDLRKLNLQTKNLNIFNKKIFIDREEVSRENMNDYLVKSGIDPDTEPNQLYMMLNSRFTLTIESESANYRRYTEKSMKPIAIRQPFLIRGNYKVLDLLKEDGFKTFHPFIDESYDNISNFNERDDFIIKEVERLMSLSLDEWQNLLEKISPILDHNHKHLSNIKQLYENNLLKYIEI
jgi:hypothetical protein